MKGDVVLTRPAPGWVSVIKVHCTPHRGLQNRTPREVLLAWEAIQLSEAPHIQL
jgi:hypothetical protein